LTTLGKLVHTVQGEQLQSPSIIVVGDVVQGARAWAAQPHAAQKAA
jgi:uroporphyrin-III C-methyltransferase